MLHFGTEHSPSQGSAGSATRRKPFNLFSNIFRKKTKELEIGITDASDETVEYSDSDITFENSVSLPENIKDEQNQNSRPLTPPILVIPQPCTTSCQEKTLAEDMVALQLPQQDSPIVQNHLDHLSTPNKKNKISRISPTPEIDKEALLNSKNLSSSSDNLDSYLLRSPASSYDCSAVNFTFSESNKSVLNGYDPTVTFCKRPGSELTPMNKPETSPSYCPLFESLEKKETLKPLLSKSGIGVLDTKMKEILETQKQKLCLTGHITATNKDSNRKTSLNSQRNLPRTSHQAKWTSVTETRPMSDYSNSNPLYTLKSFASLNRLRNGREETRSSLRPLK